MWLICHFEYVVYLKNKIKILQSTSHGNTHPLILSLSFSIMHLKSETLYYISDI